MRKGNEHGTTCQILSPAMLLYHIAGVVPTDSVALDKNVTWQSMKMVAMPAAGPVQSTGT